MSRIIIFYNQTNPCIDICPNDALHHSNLHKYYARIIPLPMRSVRGLPDTDLC